MTNTKLELPEGKYPATYSYVARLVRIFTEHPADDTSALVLLAYGEACRATAHAEHFDLRPVNTDHPLFEPIWQAIKGWDIQRKKGAGYAGATGTDVQIILDAIATAHAEVAGDGVLATEASNDIEDAREELQALLAIADESGDNMDTATVRTLIGEATDLLSIAQATIEATRPAPCAFAPCPFCGAAAREVPAYGGELQAVRPTFEIECGNDLCDVQPRARTANAWNRRIATMPEPSP